MTRHRQAAGGAEEPDWSRYRLRVTGAPPDVSVYLLEMRDVARWALGATDCLTPEEAERPGRLEDPRRRELFLVSRVVLRHVLARRLDCAPAEVPLPRDPAGGTPLAAGDHGDSSSGVPLAVADARGSSGDAPRAAGAPGEFFRGASLVGGAPEGAGLPTFYSLARTPGFVAIALASRPVGVDVEALQSPAQAAALLEVLHPEDRARLLRVPQRRRPRAVTDAWVRLEAVLKARGVGLAIDPARVPVGRRRRTRLPGGWQVTGVRVGHQEGVRLAVAWRAGDRRS